MTALILIGLLAGSSVALAQTDEEEAVETKDLTDTLFNFGYDLINRILLWSVSPLDGPYDCTLEGGTLTATYGEASEEGLIPVDELDDETGATVTFPNRPAEEVDGDPADGPIAYSGAEGECGVSGGEVSGPNGQVNHGMFMKLFNSLYEGKGRGCVVRHLAQSDLGKGDQQVKAGEDTEFVSAVPGDTGEVDFTTVETDCEHGKKDQDHEDDEGDTQRGGKPDHAGKPENSGKPDAPGKSGSAPGQDK